MEERTGGGYYKEDRAEREIGWPGEDRGEKGRMWCERWRQEEG